ncbi:MAG: alanine racemase [Polyangiales bacterium]
MCPDEEDAPNRDPKSVAALRPTRAIVDLNAIVCNYRAISKRVNRAEVIAVVKADAYGHGIVPVARALQNAGAKGFGVALAEEGLLLREAGISRTILVLNGVYAHAHRDVVQAGLTPVIYDLGQAQAFAEANPGRAVDVHLKIDTGMTRLGVPDGTLQTFLDRLTMYPSIQIAGAMTHLATAGDNPEFVNEQLDRFDRAVALLRAAGHSPRVLHAANSEAIFTASRSHYDWVRPGIALYGGGSHSELRPALRWRTEVVRVATIEKGASVGYGQTFVAKKSMTIATLPLGYGDGLMRALSDRGEVLIGGMRCPIVGRVSMDLTTVDVSQLPHAAVGDEVVIIGEQKAARLTATDVAARAGTIDYEVLTNISKRVPRSYRG